MDTNPKQAYYKWAHMQRPACAAGCMHRKMRRPAQDFYKFLATNNCKQDETILSNYSYIKQKDLFITNTTKLKFVKQKRNTETMVLPYP